MSVMAKGLLLNGALDARDAAVKSPEPHGRSIKSSLFSTKSARVGHSHLCSIMSRPKMSTWTLGAIMVVVPSKSH